MLPQVHFSIYDIYGGCHVLLPGYTSIIICCRFCHKSDFHQQCRIDAFHETSWKDFKLNFSGKAVLRACSAPLNLYIYFPLYFKFLPTSWNLATCPGHRVPTNIAFYRHLYGKCSHRNMSYLSYSERRSEFNSQDIIYFSCQWLKNVFF